MADPGTEVGVYQVDHLLGFRRQPPGSLLRKHRTYGPPYHHGDRELSSGDKVDSYLRKWTTFLNKLEDDKSSDPFF